MNQCDGDGLVAAYVVAYIGSIRDSRHRIMIPLDRVDDASIAPDRNVVRARYVLLPVGAHDVQEPVDQRRVGDMQVGAITGGFFHAIGQIAKGIKGALHRDCQAWTYFPPRNDNVDILRFEPSENG